LRRMRIGGRPVCESGEGYSSCFSGALRGRDDVQRPGGLGSAMLIGSLTASCATI
jgi:hypothetical protein